MVHNTGPYLSLDASTQSAFKRQTTQQAITLPVTAPATAMLSRDLWRKKSKAGLLDALQESPRNMGYPPLT